MLTKKEMSIIELFRKDLLDSYSIREVMKKINTKSYNWTYKAVKKLEKERIISLKRKGKSELCSINLEEQGTFSLLAFLEETQSLNRKVPNVKKIIQLMPRDFHILLITGSYVDNTFTRKSDLDIVVIIDKKEERKSLLNKLQRKGELMIPELHPYVFTNQEFLEMLASKEENYGKEIAKKHLIMAGAEFYFKIIKEAIDNGFKG